MTRRFSLLVLLLAAISTAWAATPRYIFYFIGDGMGMGHVMAAETYNREVRKAAEPLLMMRFPVVGMSMTYSASSPVTDSAAAGTALSTGHKTNNNYLGVTPDTTAVESMAKVLQRDGYGIGICTSVYPDDATPGAFFAHVPSRSMYYEIGTQAAESGYEFLAGSNLRGVVDKQGRPTDLYEVLEKSGYSVVRGADAISSVTTDKIFLLSPDSTRVSNIGYTIDSIPGALTLPEITRQCLSHLEKLSPDKFFMMIEGGNIDHAAHANDGGAVIKEIVNFNEALQVAYDFYLQHPDETLIVVTADHDTGGMALGNKYLKYQAHLEYIDYQRMSKDEFSDECKAILKSRRVFTWDDMRQMLEEKFGFWKGVPVSEKQEQALKEKFEQTFELRNSEDQKTLYNSFNAFAVEVFDVLDAATGIGWTTTSHTGNPVPVYAVGVGAERFASLNNNTDIPQKILQIVGK
ncbi:MAG: alkaline phosphatase [Bacteroidales bacterium]|nr:alkaline phosphatase [Bacteroidales bacterium]